MQYQVTPTGNLAIKLDGVADQEFIQDLLDRHGGDDQSLMVDILEATGWRGNGQLEMIRPETVGALTDGILLCDEVSYSDDGECSAMGNVWWDSNYQVKNFAETLLTHGVCYFLAAPENKKPVLH